MAPVTSVVDVEQPGVGERRRRRRSVGIGPGHHVAVGVIGQRDGVGAVADRVDQAGAGLPGGDVGVGQGHRRTCGGLGGDVQQPAGGVVVGVGDDGARWGGAGGDVAVVVVAVAGGASVRVGGGGDPSGRVVGEPRFRRRWCRLVARCAAELLPAEGDRAVHIQRFTGIGGLWGVAVWVVEAPPAPR